MHVQPEPQAWSVGCGHQLEIRSTIVCASRHLRWWDEVVDNSVSNVRALGNSSAHLPTPHAKQNTCEGRQKWTRQKQTRQK
mmetsp:Transcript_21377/g.59252  ORF Transcript_21377/g.59252 Transcript_21377/m.59252 type:complete len:81 (-) Transcript_21377:83-325(-)